MASDLCLVKSTASGCVIYRETTGRFVVGHEASPDQWLDAATMAGAYAACHGWDRVIESRHRRGGG